MTVKQSIIDFIKYIIVFLIIITIVIIISINLVLLGYVFLSIKDFLVGLLF